MNEDSYIPTDKDIKEDISGNLLLIDSGYA